MRTPVLALTLAALAALACTPLAAQGLRLSRTIGPEVPPSVPAPTEAQRAADFIVAVVNNEPITNVQVNQEVRRVLQQFAAQRRAVPDSAEVARQVLERMINDKAQLQLARETGVRVDDAVPSELHPGIDYAAHAFDPEGHCILLYTYMEQIGWDGKPRPQHLRRQVTPGVWPEKLEAVADSYGGEPYLGPWA
mgnify:CR=1 FL=1